MVNKITIDLKAVESMLFIWASLKDKEKIADEFFIDLAATPEMEAAYDDEFTPNGFRKVLSALVNRELMSDANAKEKRFWNNNMWMTEDLEVTQMMLEPLKQMNLDKRLAELPETVPYQDVEVIFYPGTTELSSIKGNKLYINFFKIQVDVMGMGEEPKIDGQLIPDFVLLELAKMR